MKIKHKFNIGQTVWFDRAADKSKGRPASIVCATVESIELLRVKHAQPIYRLSGTWLDGFHETELRDKP